MILDARLADLLVRWDEARRQGQPATPEELCRDCPEWLEELKLRIQASRRLSSLIHTPLEPLDTPSPPQPHESAAGLPELAGYELLGELGRGGMGIVYQAYDRSRWQMVALKTLRGAEPAALYRLKQEFRTLAGVAHPNLVSFYALVSDGRQWFVTMELVDGVNFLAHLRQGAGEATAQPTQDSSLPELSRVTLDCSIHRDPQPLLSPTQLDRLRAVLRQLATAVTALHEMGKVHRDIKPTNVLVTPEGRVVLLDFGLAAELDRSGLYQSTEEHVIGTVAYMAPEQAAGQPVTPAGDWYSVGVMLYEALTGQLPHQGSTLQVLMEKQRHDPPAPRALIPSIPEDLNALCVELLRLSPESRPSGHEVLRRLGAEPAQASPVSPRSAQARRASFVGRQRHLAALTEAFRATRRGAAVTVYLHGRSGTGKSQLAQHFLDDILGRGEAVVLAGRCYERESVPYKAFDSLVDALSRYLRRLPVLEAQALLPREVHLLTRIFPVLQRVEAVAEAPHKAGEIVDPQELRRRAFAALRELLARLGDRKPLILFIDDLQWGDVDSAAQLVDLLRPPDPPVLLLLGCYRSEDAAGSPCLRLLLQRPEKTEAVLDRRELAVEVLAEPEACNLALALLGRDDPATRAQALAIGRESGGHPFFVHELVQRLAQGGEPSEAGNITLDQVLWGRIRGLPEPARQLLEVIAVSGQPLLQNEACWAADLGTDERTGLANLLSGRLIRTTGPAGREEVETYHDRVRETVVAHLSANTLRDLHRRLALSLEASGHADAEALAVHWQGAHEPEKAGPYYARAADRAAETLAFDRATRLFRLALGLRPAGEAERHSLRAKLADALANAGRSAEAAHEYVAAAAGAATTEALELQRRAAMQFLISGHIEEGLGVLQTVLRAVGMKLPSTPRRALACLLLRRAQLWLRGLGFRSRDPGQISAEDLNRIDICWAAGVGLSATDVIQGAHFGARGLLLALRAGEPYRIARALALEAGHVSTAGGRARLRTAKLLQATDELAQQVGHPHALGMASLAKGLAAYMEGCWQNARGFCDQAEQVFRERCTGAAWELDTAQVFSLWSLTYMGEVAELSRRWPVLLKEAQERGDLYAETNFSTYIMSIVRLGADDPKGANDKLRHVVEHWSRHGFHVQHHNAVLARALIDLYNGDGEAAWNHIAEQWKAYTSSLLLRVQQIHINILELRGCSAVAAASTAPDPRPFLRAAEQDARRLDRQKMPWSEALAFLIRAGVAAVREERSEAIRLYTEAANRLDAVDMRIYAEAVRWRLGELVGGDNGQALVAQASAWMASQQIRNPARMAAMFAPAARSII